MGTPREFKWHPQIVLDERIPPGTMVLLDPALGVQDIGVICGNAITRAEKAEAMVNDVLRVILTHWPANWAMDPTNPAHLLARLLTHLKNPAPVSSGEDLVERWCSNRDLSTGSTCVLPFGHAGDCIAPE